MTNHWLLMVSMRLGVHPADDDREDEIHRHGKATEEHDGNEDNNRRAFKFVPTGPSAFLELFASLADVIPKFDEVSGAPKPDKGDANDDGPDDNGSI